MARLSPQGKFRALDSNGDPLSGGKLYTYEAGTSTPKDTYTTEDESVANANPVILDSNGFADVWLASGSYKLVLTDSADVTQWTVDDVIGSGAEGYLSAVVSQATSLNVTAAYQNNLIICTAALTLSLLPAATAGEGFVFTVKNTGAGNVTVDPDGSETIDGSATLTIGPGGTADIVCDGSNWVSVSGTSTLESLTDVTVTSASEGQSIYYDGSGWINGGLTIAQLVTAYEDTDVAQQTSSSSTFTDITYMTASITPKSTNSRIIVVMECGSFIDNASVGLDLRLLRDATTIETATQFEQSHGSVTSAGRNHVFLHHVDSPSTVSSVTYKLQFASSFATAQVGIERPSRVARKVTLIEVLI